MQLNGTTTTVVAADPITLITMAASEPPEPPPRNPDKINASLKQIHQTSSDPRATKSLDTTSTTTTVIANTTTTTTTTASTTNNNKPFKTVLSLNDTTPTTIPLAGLIQSSTDESLQQTAAAVPTEDNVPKSINACTTVGGAGGGGVGGGVTISAANISTTNNVTTPPNTTVENLNGIGGEMKMTDARSVGSISSAGSSGNDSNLLSDASAASGGRGGVVALRAGAIFKNNAEVTTPIGPPPPPPQRNSVSISSSLSLHSNQPSIDQVDGNLTDSVTTKDKVTSENDVKLKLENERLTKELVRLKKLFEYSEDGAVGGIELSDSNSFDAHSTDGGGSSSRIERLEAELKLAKQQIAQLKNERKKLKSDKSDLLAHVRQLCSSLQDKEQELRDFIRNFEHRIRETDASNAKVSSDRERERWSLLKHSRDESERSLALAAQLNARDIQLQRIQEQLHEARRQLSGCMSDQESLLSFAPLTPPSGGGGGGILSQHHISGHASSSGFGSMSGGVGGPGDRGSCSADSGLRGSSDRESAAGDMNLSDGTGENGPSIIIDPDSISLVSSHHNMYQYGTPKDCSPTLSPLNSSSYSRSIDVNALSRSVEHLGSPVEGGAGDPTIVGGPSTSASGNNVVTRRLQMKSATSSTGTLGTRSGRNAAAGAGGGGGGGTWGSISRVFARTRHRNKNATATAAAESGECSSLTHASDYQWSPLTEESYAEKLRILREASAMPIDRWRASQVLSWLEVALGMPQYSTRCAENVKSGKVLLELNDGELETGLGLTHPMHRKKLRLAIEEQRRPELIRYQTIGQLGHTWVASEWLPDIGLPQYAETFLHSLVDARMLDTLSKKELEKFLSVTRKFHQASIVHGIHVLRILKYDRQALAMRRIQCENVDSDPIVWTNQRFIRWARSIDLGEYADNLKDSGVHGGLVVLEPSFSGDTIATALGIPSSKNIIRRHLTTEFDALVLPARAQLGQGIRTGGGSVVPITGPGGLQQHHPHHHHHQQHHTVDRRSNGNLRFAAWRGSQGSLSKAFRFSSKNRNGGGGGGGNSTSPTPSYSSSSENGIYATIGPPYAPPPPAHCPPAMLPSQQQQQGVPPSHRVSAPPMDSPQSTSSLPRYAQHRRVKSISDIEIVAATPV